MTNRAFRLLVAIVFITGSVEAAPPTLPPQTPEEFEAYLAVIVNDHEKAAKLLPAMAEKGHVLAQSPLGQMYLKGLGVKQDFLEATKWLGKASAQGDGESSYTLGIMYELGHGVTKDAVRGTEFFERASEQGDKKSPAILAAKYAQGIGVSKDDVSAYVWASIGAAYGDEDAKKYRDELESNMPRKEMLDAQKTAREWFVRLRNNGK
jgi:TPR repeat protein